MSAFSEVFTAIKDRRNLSVAQIAEVCEKDATVLFQWFGGIRCPQNWEQIRNVVDRLRLSEDEYRELKDSYEKTVLGEEYASHKKMLEIFEVLEQRRDEYFSFQETNVTSGGQMQLPEFIKLRTKMEVLGWIQRVIEYLIGKEDKKLHLKFQTLHQEVMMLLKIFCSRIQNCKIEELVYLHEGEGADDYNLDVLKEMIEILVQKNAVDIYCLEECNCEQGFGENWIMSNDFVIQYNEDLTAGMLFSGPKWIEFYKNSFDEIKKQSNNLGKKDLEVMDFNSSYEGGYVRGFSIEYMPCVGNCLTRELIEEHIYPGIPGRDMIIEGILALHYISDGNRHFRWDSCFSKEGLTEFMENGRIENFPYMIYKELTKEARCQILQNAIELLEQGEFVYHMVCEGELPLMKNLYVEQMNGERNHLVVDMHFDGAKERFRITNAGLQEKIWQFFSRLEKCGYVYSVKDTALYMKKVLIEYKEKFEIL